MLRHFHLIIRGQRGHGRRPWYEYQGTCLNSHEVRTYGTEVDGPNKFAGYPGVSSGDPWCNRGFNDDAGFHTVLPVSRECIFSGGNSVTAVSKSKLHPPSQTPWVTRSCFIILETSNQYLLEHRLSWVLQHCKRLSGHAEKSYFIW